MRAIMSVLFVLIVIATGVHAADDSDKSVPKLNVSIQLFEINQSMLSDLGIDASKPESEIPSEVVKGLERTLRDLKKAKKLKVIAEPSLTVAAKRTGSRVALVNFEVPASESELPPGNEEATPPENQ